MKIIFKALLTADAISLLLAVYLIKCQLWVCWLGNFSGFVYIAIPLLIAIFCDFLSIKLSPDSVESDICNIELANDAFLPTYLGYFFVN